MNKSEKLILTWKPGPHKRKTPIGELVFDGQKYFFKYIIDNEKYNALKAKGFNLYTPFNDLEKIYNSNAFEVFRTRLPDRSRPDFKNIISFWDIKDLSISNFDLIKVSGAKLPTDGFEFIYDFSNAEPPFTLLINVAGVHYYRENASFCESGQNVQLVKEPDNNFDPDAVKVELENGKTIGYAPLVQAKALSKFLESNKVEASINKVYVKLNNIGIQIKLTVS